MLKYYISIIWEGVHAELILEISTISVNIPVLLIKYDLTVLQYLHVQVQYAVMIMNNANISQETLQSLDLRNYQLGSE